jgi:uncharacterized protein YbjT (DUF2867 family)
VRQLSDAGLPVRAMVRNARDAGTLAGQKVDLVEGNFDKPETLDAALRGADKAFLLTPVAEKFVEWQRTFIEAARRAGVKHLVKFSGMGASATAPAELLRMHAQTDEVLGGSGIPFTILRPNSFHQNILASAGTIKAQGVFYLPLKHAAQSIVDIRDINAVAAKVLTTAGHEGKTYVITGPEALTFDQVAEKLSSVLGRRIQYVDVPPQAAADGMRKSGMPEWSVRVVVELLEYFASGAAATATDSVPKVLGKPGISFEQFARDFKPAFGG